MITAITHGIPCIIHKSTAYEELLKKTGLEDFIVNSYDNLEQKIKYLSHYKNKEKYLKKIQEYVWKKYNNIIIAKKLLNIIQKHL